MLCAIIRLTTRFSTSSQCIFSVLLRWAHAIKVDPNFVIIQIFSKFPRKDTDNTRSFCLISAHRITILGVEEDIGHWGMTEMRRREVHQTKKRPSTPYLKCYHSLHKTLDHWSFFKSSLMQFFNFFLQKIFCLQKKIQKKKNLKKNIIGFYELGDFR